MSNYAGLINQLEKLARNPPAKGKDQQALLAALRNAHFALEGQADVIYRLAFAPLQTSVALVASDLDLFSLVASRKGSTVTLEELAAKTRAKSLLIRRTLRFLSCHGLVKEVQPGVYTPTHSTHFMTSDGVKAGLRHNHDLMVPVWTAMPKFLRERNYENIEDILDSPFQAANDTKLTPFQYISDASRVEALKNFHLWLSAHQDLLPSWLDVFPLDLLLDTSSTSGRPLLVDVGGGRGHQCEGLKSKYPQIQGAIILQDLNLPTATKLDQFGILRQVYNFFDEQPVRGARFYYLKSVLHDWPDDKAREILRNQVPALSSESRILIDEIVLPETGAHWRAVDLDLGLMPITASIERTESHWQELLSSVGLVVERTWKYDDETGYAIQMARLQVAQP